MMAASRATRPSLSQSSGNRISGSRHPKASTLMIASKTQASPSPTGMAAMNVTIHSARVRRTSSIARSRRRSPSAQTGASCGSRSEASVSWLENMAKPATASVSTLSAPVTANVCSKIAADYRFSETWSTILASGRPNSVMRRCLKPATSCGCMRRPYLSFSTSG